MVWEADLADFVQSNTRVNTKEVCNSRGQWPLYAPHPIRACENHRSYEMIGEWDPARQASQPKSMIFMVPVCALIAFSIK